MDEVAQSARLTARGRMRTMNIRKAGNRDGHSGQVGCAKSGGSGANQIAEVSVLIAFACFAAGEGQILVEHGRHLVEILAGGWRGQVTAGSNAQAGASDRVSGVRRS